MHVRSPLLALVALLVFVLPLAAQDVSPGNLPALYGVTADEVRAVYPADAEPSLRNATLFYLVSHRGFRPPEGIDTASSIVCNASSNLTIRDSVGTGSQVGSLPMGASAEVIAHGSLDSPDGTVHVPFLQIRHEGVEGWVLGLSRWVNVTANDREPAPAAPAEDAPGVLADGEAADGTADGETQTLDDLDAVTALKEAWIRNWMANHPEATREEAEAAWEEVSEEVLASAAEGGEPVDEGGEPLGEGDEVAQTADADAQAALETELLTYLATRICDPLKEGNQSVACPFCVLDEAARTAHPFPALVRVGETHGFTPPQSGCDAAFVQGIVDHLASEHGVPRSVLRSFVDLLNVELFEGQGLVTVPEAYEETVLVAEAESAEGGEQDLEAVLQGEAIVACSSNGANATIYASVLESIRAASGGDAAARKLAEARFICLLKLLRTDLVGLDVARLREIEEAWLVAEGVVPSDQTLAGQINLASFPAFRAYMTEVRKLYARHLGTSEKDVLSVLGDQLLGFGAALDGFRRKVAGELELEGREALDKALKELIGEVQVTLEDGSTTTVSIDAVTVGNVEGLATRLEVLPYLVRTMKAMNPGNFSPLVILCLADRFRLGIHENGADRVPAEKALELLAADGTSRDEAQQVVLALFKARSWNLPLELSTETWREIQESYLKRFVSEASDPGELSLPVSMNGFGTGASILRRLREGLGTYLGEVEKNAVEKAWRDVANENDAFRTVVNALGELHTGVSATGRRILGGIADGIGKLIPSVTARTDDGQTLTIDNPLGQVAEEQRARANEVDFIRKTVHDVSEVMDWTLGPLAFLEAFQGKDRVAAICLLDRLQLDARKFPALGN